jgi:predicted NBD/HSP70 family sugar kinase
MTSPIHRVGPPSIEGAAAPVRQESLRAHNLTLTFRQIVAARAAPISRSELAAATGLTRPTISRIVEILLTGGLVVEAGPARSGASGRPRVGLRLARTGPAGLGLDIRADTVSACVVDLAGAVRHLSFAPRSRRDGPERTLDAVAGLATEAVRAAAAENLTVVGATLAAPGPVQDRSLVRFAPSLGWRDVDAGPLLRARLPANALTVTVDNDASLAALGELYASHEELRNFVCVSGELDIGAGIVLGGTALRGARGWSGELGHVMVETDGAACDCGARGCLQRYAGLDAILTAGSAAGAAAGSGSDAQPPAVVIDALASAGSPEILAALDRAGRALGIAIAALVNIVDIDTVLLGGSYSLLASWLVDGIDTEIRQRVLTSAWAPVTVRPAPLGPDAAVIGAALTAVDEVRRNPTSWLARR